MLKKIILLYCKKKKNVKFNTLVYTLVFNIPTSSLY